MLASWEQDGEDVREEHGEYDARSLSFPKTDDDAQIFILRVRLSVSPPFSPSDCSFLGDDCA